MRRIVYISTSADLPETEVNRILESALRNNARMGITGFLTYNGRNFLQLIEGDQASLLKLMATLRRDPRHSGVAVMVDEVIAERCCPDWTMHRLRMADAIADRQSQLAAELPAMLAGENRRMIENFALLN